MKKLISLILIAMVITSMACAYGEGSFNLSSAQNFTMKLKRAMKVSMDVEIPADCVMQNGPSSFVINIDEISEGSSEYASISAFFR